MFLNKLKDKFMKNKTIFLYNNNYKIYNHQVANNNKNHNKNFNNK